MIAFLPVSTWHPVYIAAIRAHYTRSAGPPPGKKMAWEILDDGAHRGWIGVGEPAFKLAPRRALGLLDARPLPHTVCCTIYRLDAAGPTKASTILRAWRSVLDAAWSTRYGWAPEHVETLVDPAAVTSSVPGACFRRAGYRALGMTTGRTARRPAGSTRFNGPRVWGDGTPKLVLYLGPLPRVAL